MKYTEKRSIQASPLEVQRGNASWWTSQTMSYDWKDPSRNQRLTPEWFDDIDARFLQSARLFSEAANPFEALMSCGELQGRPVLEIGCGMGLHSEMLARAGARLVSIDLSPTSIESTRERFRLKGLSADIRQMDAESLDFPDGSFDMVWSWGVIHHSSRTGRIVGEIARVLRPGGSSRVMVYNLGGMPAYLALMGRYALGFWRGRSLDEILWQSTDGFSARFYTRDQLGDLFSGFFPSVKIEVLGQESDAIPFPRLLRSLLARMVPLSHQRRAVRRRGAFLFAVATKLPQTSERSPP